MGPASVHHRMVLWCLEVLALADQPHGFICYLAHGMAGGSQHKVNFSPARNNENQNLLPQQQQPDSVPLNAATTNSHHAVKSYIYYLLHLNER